MTNSATDHGYRSEPLPIDVWPGDTFRLASAYGGFYESRVLRPHRTIGYFETVITSPDHPQHKSIQILSREAILAAMTHA